MAGCSTFDTRDCPKRGALGIALLTLALITTALSCASHLMKDSEARILTEDKLYQINSEVRFTRFFYADKIESGLLIHWMPDSILIQERGQGQPRHIAVTGIVQIETITGNKIMPGIAIGTLAAAAYFVAVRGYDLGSVTFLEAVKKLLVPPAILLTAIGISSSMETRELYKLPPGFTFDFDEARARHEKAE